MQVASGRPELARTVARGPLCLGRAGTEFLEIICGPFFVDESRQQRILCTGQVAWSPSRRRVAGCSTAERLELSVDLIVLDPALQRLFWAQTGSSSLR